MLKKVVKFQVFTTTALQNAVKKVDNQNGEFGIGGLIMLGVGLVIILKVMYPTLTALATTILTAVENYFTNNIAPTLFGNS